MICSDTFQIDDIKFNSPVKALTNPMKIDSSVSIKDVVVLPCSKIALWYDGQNLTNIDTNLMSIKVKIAIGNIKDETLLPLYESLFGSICSEIGTAPDVDIKWFTCEYPKSFGVLFRVPSLGIKIRTPMMNLRDQVLMFAYDSVCKYMLEAFAKTVKQETGMAYLMLNHKSDDVKEVDMYRTFCSVNNIKLPKWTLLLLIGMLCFVIGGADQFEGYSSILYVEYNFQNNHRQLISVPEPTATELLFQQTSKFAKSTQTTVDNLIATLQSAVSFDQNVVTSLQATNNGIVTLMNITSNMLQGDLLALVQMVNANEVACTYGYCGKFSTEYDMIINQAALASRQSRSLSIQSCCQNGNGCSWMTSAWYEASCNIDTGIATILGDTVTWSKGHLQVNDDGTWTNIPDVSGTVVTDITYGHYDSSGIGTDPRLPIVTDTAFQKGVSTCATNDLSSCFQQWDLSTFLKPAKPGSALRPILITEFVDWLNYFNENGLSWNTLGNFPNPNIDMATCTMFAVNEYQLTAGTPWSSVLGAVINNQPYVYESQKWMSTPIPIGSNLLFPLALVNMDMIGNPLNRLWQNAQYLIIPNLYNFNGPSNSITFAVAFSRNHPIVWSQVLPSNQFNSLTNCELSYDTNLCLMWVLSGGMTVLPDFYGWFPAQNLVSTGLSPIYNFGNNVLVDGKSVPEQTVDVLLSKYNNVFVPFGIIENGVSMLVNGALQHYIVLAVNQTTCTTINSKGTFTKCGEMMFLPTCPTAAIQFATHVLATSDCTPVDCRVTNLAECHNIVNTCEFKTWNNNTWVDRNGFVCQSGISTVDMMAINHTLITNVLSNSQLLINETVNTLQTSFDVLQAAMQKTINEYLSNFNTFNQGELTLALQNDSAAMTKAILQIVDDRIKTALGTSTTSVERSCFASSLLSWFFIPVNVWCDFLNTLTAPIQIAVQIIGVILTLIVLTMVVSLLNYVGKFLLFLSTPCFKLFECRKTQQQIDHTLDSDIKGSAMCCRKLCMCGCCVASCVSRFYWWIIAMCCCKFPHEMDTRTNPVYVASPVSVIRPVAVEMTRREKPKDGVYPSPRLRTESEDFQAQMDNRRIMSGLPPI